MTVSADFAAWLRFLCVAAPEDPPGASAEAWLATTTGWIRVTIPEEGTCALRTRRRPALASVLNSIAEDVRMLASNAASTHPTAFPEYLNASEAARYLRLPSRKAVYQAARRGDIPARRFGRRIKFARNDLDRVLNRATADRHR